MICEAADDLRRGILPPIWSIPAEWPGERAFVLCGGESIRTQHDTIKKLKGRFIAIKEAVYLRPDADVLFLGGERTESLALKPIKWFQGRYMIVRGKSCPEIHEAAMQRRIPPHDILRVTRTKDHSKLCEIPTHVCGYDSGTSAMNVASLFGATEIIMIGYDMTGNRGTDEWFKHPLPLIPKSHHEAHLKPLESIAADAKVRGIHIWNASPISRATCFAYRPLESFL
jgi:hypothetical protein